MGRTGIYACRESVSRRNSSESVVLFSLKQEALASIGGSTFTEESEADKGLFNGIGNLVVLDRNINRDIKDRPVEKKAEKYQTSKYVSVRNLFSTIKDHNWDKSAVEFRRDEEIEKIKIFMDRFY